MSRRNPESSPAATPPGLQPDGRPPHRGWRQYPPRERNGPGTLGATALEVLGRLTAARGHGATRPQWWAAMADAADNWEYGGFLAAVLRLVREGEVVVVGGSAKHEQFALAARPVPAAPLGPDDWFAFVLAVVRQLCTTLGRAASTSEVREELTARCGYAVPLGKTGTSLQLLASPKPSHRRTLLPPVRGQLVKVRVPAADGGRPIAYWRPHGALDLAPPSVPPTATERLRIAVARAEVALQRPASLDEVHRWRAAHAATDPIAAALDPRKIGVAFDHIRRRTLTQGVRAHAERVQALVGPWTCYGGAPRRYTTAVVRDSEHGALPNGDGSETAAPDSTPPAALCGAGQRTVTGPEWAVQLAACRVTDLAYVLRPAEEADAIRACEVLAARTGSEAFREAAQRRQARLERIVLETLWPEQPAEPSAGGATRAASDPAGFAAAVFERCRHANATVGTWLSACGIPLATRVTHVSALRDAERHLTAVAETVRALLATWRGDDGGVGADARKPAGAAQGTARIIGPTSGVLIAAARAAANDIAGALGADGNRRTGLAERLLLSARRVPLLRWVRAMSNATAADRVDLVLSLVAQLPGHRAAVALVPAVALLGTVERDSEHLRVALQTCRRGDRVARQGITVALGLLGELTAADLAHVDVGDEFEASAACLGIVFTHLLPPTGHAAPPAVSTAWTPHWTAVMRWLHELERRTLSAGADAGFTVVNRAIQRVRGGRWYEAVEP